MTDVQKREFKGHDGNMLAARFDQPDGPAKGYAIFAHCFTCTKDILAARRIASHLSRLGIGVLRFDFTGLGSSEGEFANTSFVSNIDDLVAAARYMDARGETPTILIGHSLGGAAVLAAAAQLPSIKGVATIGAPADAEHVLHQFQANIETIETQGKAEVVLAGRTFEIGKGFIDAARDTRLLDVVSGLRVDLLIMHGPLDKTVGIDNASRIFMAAKHPKSFISLDKADHLLTAESDARYVGEIIAAWAGRFLQADEPQGAEAIEHVRVAETGNGKFQNTVQAGRHRFFADEPTSVGGTDTGPTPYDLLSAALGACTSMTLRMYASFKKMELGNVSVDVSHAKVHATDCETCSDDLKQSGGKIDHFTRIISVSTPVDDETAQKLVEIANKCPVHKTLEGGAHVTTEVTRHG